MPFFRRTKSATSASRAFLPAKHSTWFIRLTQFLLKIYLQQYNRVHISDESLKILSSIPEGHGMLLTPNHADETDPLVTIEVSRRSGKRFTLMCNREAFDEYLGLAGWGLQRIGYFSVERGASDLPAKRYSIDVTKDGSEMLVIFPEGEIFYLNDLVQPFHTGTIEIGMQAIIEARTKNPEWTAHIIPIAIKYRYSQPMKDILEDRVSKMEKKLAKDMKGKAIRQRLSALQTELLEREEQAHHVHKESQRFSNLNDRIAFVRKSMLADVEKKYRDAYRAQSSTIDQTFQLSAHLRDQLAKTVTSEHITEYTEDLQTLREVEQLVSWQPQYVDEHASAERLGEMIKKLERELYRIKRPQQLGKRDVFISVGQPIDLGNFLAQYQEEPHVVRHHVTELLRKNIQSLIDQISHETR